MLKRCQKLCVVLAVLALVEFSAAEKASISKKKLSRNSDLCLFQPNGALLDNPQDCRKFYLCIQKQAFEYNCNAGYRYDATTRRCVKGYSCFSTTNKTVSCEEGNIRSVHDDCNVFEACIKGVYQKLNCPPNYYFNAQKSICVPFKYDAEFKCNCLMPEYTVLKNEGNCETYFVCHQKTAVKEYCALGHYYNAELNTCVIDLQGVCLMNPTVASGQQSSLATDTATKCRNFGLQNIHFQTFPKGCNTFYLCVNGQLFEQHCPKDFHYDSIKKYCVFDATNKCLDAEDGTNENSRFKKNTFLQINKV